MIKLISVLQMNDDIIQFINFGIVILILSLMNEIDPEFTKQMSKYPNAVDVEAKVIPNEMMLEGNK